MTTIPAFTVFSEGTLKPVELAHALRPYVRKYLGENCATDRDLQAVIDSGEADEDAHESVNEAMLELSEYAPAACFVGFHQDDGASLGVWPDVEAADALADLIVADTSEVPAAFAGYVLHINERGNATLYEALGASADDSDSCELVEIWGVV
jgi:hypothetical protein